MTLLELLLTMALMGLVLGIGVGAFARLDYGSRSAQSSVENVLRSAHVSAQTRGAPARVDIDRQAGTIRAQAAEVIGTWRFEDEALAGALGLDGGLRGAILVDDGYIGRALSFARTRGGTAEFDVARDASFDLREGFGIEVALRAGPGSGSLLSLGDCAGLQVVEGGILRAWFVPEVQGGNGPARAGGRIYVEAAPGLLRPEAWSRVRCEYDRRILRLWIDGLEAGRTAETQPVWKLEGPLRLGDPRGTFAGALDDLVISAVTASDVVQLPDNVRFSADTPERVAFDARGALDREVHAERVQVRLEFEGGAAADVRIGMAGTVE